MKKQASSGFTLIELLIVIGVLGTLTAFLSPVFSSAREQARIAVCQSNLQQIGRAVALYAQDWDGYLPLPDRPNLPRAGFSAPRVSLRSDILGLWPYMNVKTGQTWVCPSDPHVPADCSPPHCFYQSYWFSEQLAGTETEDCDGVPVYRAYDTIPQPSSTVMVHEGGFPWPLFPNRPQGTDASTVLRNGIGNYHRGMGNFLFADGHVQLMPLRRTLTPTVLWDRYGDWHSECEDATEASWTEKDVAQTLRDLDRFPSLYAR
jgi:prepilin-type N-terminal cleavage/methylation domain-containing protein/prepilin-type processing-associated H-X9-DG protein